MAKIRDTKKTHGLIDSQKRITVEVKVENLWKFELFYLCMNLDGHL
jgi:hypothetical protein